MDLFLKLSQVSSPAFNSIEMLIISAGRTHTRTSIKSLLNSIHSSERNFLKAERSKSKHVDQAGIHLILPPKQALTLIDLARNVLCDSLRNILMTDAPVRPVFSLPFESHQNI